MAEKGLAVSQIILLVLGILVLAVVAYLLYTNFISTGGSIGAEQCRAAATNQCTSCALGGFLAGSGKSCEFDKINSVTQKETTLAICQRQGNVIAGTGPDSTKGYLDCTGYIGGSIGGEVGNSNPTPSNNQPATNNPAPGSNTPSDTDAPSETGGSSGSAPFECPPGYKPNALEDSCDRESI